MADDNPKNPGAKFREAPPGPMWFSSREGADAFRFRLPLIGGSSLGWESYGESGAPRIPFKPLRYTEESVKLIYFETKGYGSEEHGIGKNYDGYRAIFVPTEGYIVYDQSPTGPMTRKKDDTETKARIERFRKDVKEAAERDPKMAAFVEQHKQAMGLE